MYFSPLELEVQTLNYNFRLLEIIRLQLLAYDSEKNHILNPEIIFHIQNGCRESGPVHHKLTAFPG